MITLRVASKIKPLTRNVCKKTRCPGLWLFGRTDGITDGQTDGHEQREMHVVITQRGHNNPYHSYLFSVCLLQKHTCISRH